MDSSAARHRLTVRVDSTTYALLEMIAIRDDQKVATVAAHLIEAGLKALCGDDHQLLIESNKNLWID